MLASALIQESQGLAFLSQLVVTPARFAIWAEDKSRGAEAAPRGRSAGPHHDFGREQGFMQYGSVGRLSWRSDAVSCFFSLYFASVA